MKPLIVGLTALSLLTACEDMLNSIIGEGTITPKESLTWTSSETLLFVRGKNYKVTKSTGRDTKTGEVIIVEFESNVTGSKKRCGTGTIENCRKGIERELDKLKEKEGKPKETGGGKD